MNYLEIQQYLGKPCRLQWVTYSLKNNYIHGKKVVVHCCVQSIIVTRCRVAGSDVSVARAANLHQPTTFASHSDIDEHMIAVHKFL